MAAFLQQLSRAIPHHPAMRAVLLLIATALADPCPPNAAAFTRPSGITDNMRVKYSNIFSVIYHENYKVVQYDPTQSVLKYGWPNSAMVGQAPPDLVLYECGTTKPTTAFNDVKADAHFISIPPERVSLPGTQTFHVFELLSVTEAIHLIDMSYASSPCMQLLEECTPGIHAAPGTSAWQTAMQDAQVTFTNSWGSGASNTTRDVVFSASVDGGILHRVEWLKFVALFFNKEVMGAQIFDQIAADVLALEAESARLRAASEENVPSVAWVANQACSAPECAAVTAGSWVQKADGNWCRCGSFYLIYNSLYRRDLTTNAGGRLLSLPGQSAENCTLTTNSDGSRTYECTSENLQHFLQLLGGADLIIDETFVLNHGAYSLDDFVRNFGLDGANAPSLKAREAGAVYRIDGSVSDARADGTVGTNWYEQMPVQPQVLQSEMMEAIWGSAFKGRCAKTYMRHLYNDHTRDPLEHSDCPLYDAGGSHDCAAIHDYEHTVHQCMPAPAAEASGSDPLVLGLALGLGIPLCLLLLSVLGYCIYRSQKPPKTPVPSPTGPGGAVVGIPVSDAGEKA